MLTRLRYEARALPVPLLAAVVALSIAPAVVALVRGGTHLAAVVVAAVVIGGGGAALASSDPAAAVLAPVPIPLVRRWGVRLAVIAGVTVSVWAAALAAVLWRDPAAVGRPGDRLGELAAVAGVSAAAGAYAERRGSSVVAACVFGPMGVLVVSATAYRFPDLPIIAGQGDGATWAVLGAGAWAASLWERRDPYGFARPRLCR